MFIFTLVYFAGGVAIDEDLFADDDLDDLDEDLDELNIEWLRLLLFSYTKILYYHFAKRAVVGGLLLYFGEVFLLLLVWHFPSWQLLDLYFFVIDAVISAIGINAYIWLVTNNNACQK